MYRLLLILLFVVFFGGCTQQARSLSIHNQGISPYSLEALDARYHQGR